MAHPIPQAALAHHIAFLGKTGSGKSNAAKVIAEEALDAGERVCIIDPTGSWWGLRLKASGKPSNYPVVIFGGLHADVPIMERHGEPIAELIATSSTPAVIDTRLMTVGQRTLFFTDFAETLLRKNRGPLRLIIDEAHVFAPQGRVADPNSGKMLHAANNLVSLGRSIGLRIIMISQRPAKLHKDSLTQVETLVAMRLIAPQDRSAVEDWIGEWADKIQGKEIIASLPSMPTGDAWVWSPEANFLKRVHFPLARTYDSGKAPIAGEAGPELKSLDLATVNQLLDKAFDEFKANDPRYLKAEIARLTRELSAARKPPPPPERIDASKEQLENARAEGRRLGISIGITRAQQALAKLRVDGPDDTAAPEAVVETKKTYGQDPIEIPVARSAPRANSTHIRDKLAQSDGSVPAGCSRPLAVLAGFHPAGMTEAQWALAAGYKRTGGTWGTYKSRLRQAGLIEQRGKEWFATDAAAEAVGAMHETPPVPGPSLVRWWTAKLPGTAKIAEALIEAYPESLTKDELADRVGMVASGGSFGTYLSRLASPGLILRDGGVIQLAPEVMGS